jgi:cell division protein ZapA
LTVRINGYAYSLGCEDGQEDHLQAMAQQVERRIEGIKALGSQSGEARLLVLAALLMADELHDLKADMAKSDPQLPPAEADRDVARHLQLLADRAEAIADTVEQS